MDYNELAQLRTLWVNCDECSDVVTADEAVVTPKQDVLCGTCSGGEE